MNRRFASLLLVVSFGLFLERASCQYEAGWTTPIAPNQSDMVTLIYDVSQGNGALLEEEPPCPPCPFIYIHTGVITSESSGPSDWQFVQNPWPNGNNLSEANSGNVLLPLGGTLHSFDFGGMTLSEFYGVPDGVEIQKLAFLFRNADGTRVGAGSDSGEFYVDVSALPSQPEGGQYTVHFRVNMVNEEVSPSGVHVVGDFQGWDPAATELTDPDGDMIYETTQLIDTSFSEITFKFINGNAWTDLAELTDAECGDMSGNRVLALDSSEIVLSADDQGNPYCFNSCEQCILPLLVTFNLDTTGLSGVSENGIHIAGSFQGWDPGGTPLIDNGDGTWSVTVEMTPGTYEFKFINGNAWNGNEENMEGSGCANGGNRIATFDADNNTYTACFNTCPGEVCTPMLPAAPITFQLNLNSDQLPSGVDNSCAPWIFGNFTGWQAGALQMNDADGDGIWQFTLTNEILDFIELKYAYSIGNPNLNVESQESGLWSVEIDSTTTEFYSFETELCGVSNGFGGFIRSHIRSGEAEILDVVCWNRCSDCEPTDLDNGGEEGVLCILDADNNGVCDDQEVYGCSYPLAENFSSSVTRDDGSCIFPCEGVVNTNVFDWDGDYVVTVIDFLMMLSVYGDTDVDLDGVWDSEDLCADTDACNYDLTPTEACVYVDALGVCGGDCGADEDADGICDDVDTCVGIEDECGVCNGPGPTEAVIDDIIITYDSIYLPVDEEWFVYAVNVDTTYGYLCAPSFNDCGDQVSYEGYDYATVLIGDQCWFAENLRSENYNNGDAIPSNLNDTLWEQTSIGAVAVYGEWSSTCITYSPDGDACDEAWSLSEYGRLYNWYAVDDARGLCPSGWHVPSDGEWTLMTEFLGVDSVAGSQMKATYGWANSGNGTNSSGFSGLPSGYRGSDGSFNVAGYYGDWWSSTPNGDSKAWIRALSNLNNDVLRNDFGNQRYGFSVRCIRDAE